MLPVDRSKTGSSLPIFPRMKASLAELARAQTLRWVYLALIVLGSIGAHLTAEFAAMGGDADEVALSPRHLYLGLAAVAALAFALCELIAMRKSSSGARDFKRRMEIGIGTLPLAGTPWFTPATAASFLTIGGITEIGEGCPLCGHDVTAGVIGAFLGSLLVGLVVRAFTRRMPSLASAVDEYLTAEPHDSGFARYATAFAPARLPRSVWYPFLFNRPPPVRASR
jgi:hypothetical protein